MVIFSRVDEDGDDDDDDLDVVDDDVDVDVDDDDDDNEDDFEFDVDGDESDDASEHPWPGAVQVDLEDEDSSDWPEMSPNDRVKVTTMASKQMATWDLMVFLGGVYLPEPPLKNRGFVRKAVSEILRFSCVWSK